MKYKLRLEGFNYSEEVILFTPEEEVYNKYADITVFQNESYRIILELDINSYEVEEIDVFINNESVIERYNLSYKIKEKKIIFQSEYLFSTIFGFSNIFVEVKLMNGEKLIFYTELISVAVERDKESINSLYKMIDYIYKKNSALLHKSTSDRSSKVLSDLQKSPYKSFDTELELLNNIVQIYSNNFKYFMNDLKRTIKSQTKVDNFEKIKSINSDTIRYIVCHPEQLTPVEYYTGIKFTGENLQPVKTLVDDSQYSYDIYENKVVLGFLKYVINLLSEKICKVNYALQENEISGFISKSVKEGYVLSSEIIYRYSRGTMVNYVSEINKINIVLKDLYLKYKEVIKCKDENVYSVPKPTEIFLSIQHYRNIYDVIVRWFKYGNYNMNSNRVLLSFLTADEIFEYYTLLNFIDALKSLGYFEDEYKRICYEYDVNYKDYRNIKIDNTFYFSNGDTNIILYYQPVVYSYISDFKNDISLFRVDKRRGYFIPDFILKVYSSNGMIKYLIFDSKWSKRKSIKKYYLDKCLFRYLCSIRSENSTNDNKSVWLIQGRDDEFSNPYFNNNSEICRDIRSDLEYESGIIKLTPDYSDNEFIDILHKLLIIN